MESLYVFQISVSVDKKILMLFNINDPENRIELTFQRHYGHIVSYRWYIVPSLPNKTQVNVGVMFHQPLLSPYLEGTVTATY